MAQTNLSKQLAHHSTVVTAPGANSGKLATCLSQLYHETKRGRRTGYSEFKKYSVWNLPLESLLVAYELIADLEDVNIRLIPSTLQIRQQP